MGAIEHWDMLEALLLYCLAEGEAVLGRTR